MEEILRRCPSLQLLVVMSRDDDFISSLQEEEVFKNPRFLVLPNYHWPVPRPKYWANIRNGGPDVFDNAEEIRRDNSQVGKDISVSHNSRPLPTHYPLTFPTLTMAFTTANPSRRIIRGMPDLPLLLLYRWIDPVLITIDIDYCPYIGD